jgi:hypothetical protein
LTASKVLEVYTLTYELYAIYDVNSSENVA